jgi:hypothetical protein
MILDRRISQLLGEKDFGFKPGGSWQSFWQASLAKSKHGRAC